MCCSCIEIGSLSEREKNRTKSVCKIAHLVSFLKDEEEERKEVDYERFWSDLQDVLEKIEEAEESEEESEGEEEEYPLAVGGW